MGPAPISWQPSQYWQVHLPHSLPIVDNKVPVPWPCSLLENETNDVSGMVMLARGLLSASV